MYEVRSVRRGVYEVRSYEVGSVRRGVYEVRSV